MSSLTFRHDGGLITEATNSQIPNLYKHLCLSEPGGLWWSAVMSFHRTEAAAACRQNWNQTPHRASNSEPISQVLSHMADCINICIKYYYNTMYWSGGAVFTLLVSSVYSSSHQAALQRYLRRKRWRHFRCRWLQDETNNLGWGGDKEEKEEEERCMFYNNNTKDRTSVGRTDGEELLIRGKWRLSKQTLLNWFS